MLSERYQGYETAYEWIEVNRVMAFSVGGRESSWVTPHVSWDLKEVREWASHVSGWRTFQTKGTASAKALLSINDSSYKELGSYFYLSESISGGSTAGLARDMERAHQDRLYVETWVESKKKEEARVFEFMSV